MRLGLCAVRVEASKVEHVSKEEPDERGGPDDVEREQTRRKQRLSLHQLGYLLVNLRHGRREAKVAWTRIKGGLLAGWENKAEGAVPGIGRGGCYSSLQIALRSPTCGRWKAAINATKSAVTASCVPFAL